ncbi:MAG: TonB-dependent receptor [Bacteroidales bacterium]|nr:TonB-dependent receptor [Bacteroidales bacterium]
MTTGSVRRVLRKCLAVFYLTTASFLSVQAQTGDTASVAGVGVELEEVTVSARRQGTILSSLTQLKTETITSSGLMKMACCSLSESFENSATVSAGYSDAISGARTIRLLGLSGMYSSMLDENIPTMRGLSATYGWSYIPAAWLESIQISKGAASVVNGYESVTGQMNLEFRKPHNSEPLFVNLYADDARHWEGNAAVALPAGRNLWAGLLLHGVSAAYVHDKNGDTFMDMPKYSTVHLYNRWFYLNEEKGIQSRTGVRYLHDRRKAGQDSACHANDGLPLFETFITNRNITVYNKTGIAVGNKEGQSVGIIGNFTRHEQASDFGKKAFDGVQTSLYLNLLFTSFVRSAAHRYTAGASLAYDRYDTEYLDSLAYNATPPTRFRCTEAVPGVFVEYTRANPAGWTLTLGLRADRNSLFGWMVTPRAHFKYDVGNYVIVRASAGRGFRSPNAIADNNRLMASSRRFETDEIPYLEMESAWNTGGSVTVYLPLQEDRRAALSIDYFHTEFQRQTVADTERDRHAVYFYNLAGRSYADAWQADLSLPLLEGFDLFAAFRYNRNKITYTGEDGARYLVDKPLVSACRGLLNLSYATRFKRWVFDATAQINGPSRMPGMNGYHSQKIYSPAFPVLFAQISKNSKRFDMYAGVENLLNKTQDNPVRGWSAPFHLDFDASLVWGPLLGRKIYCGVRIRIGEIK